MAVKLYIIAVAAASDAPPTMPIPRVMLGMSLTTLGWG